MTVFETQSLIKILLPLILQLAGVYYAAILDPYMQERQRKLFLTILWLEFSLVIQDVLAFILGEIWVNIPLRICVSVYGYTIRPLVIVLFLRLVDRDMDLTLSKVMVLVNGAVYCTSFFTDMAFTIDANNKFHRGPMGYMVHVLSFILLIILAVKSVKTFYESKRMESVIPIVCCVLIIASALGDTVLYLDNGISFLTITMVSSAVFYYIWLHLQIVRNHENSLMAEQRIQIMMSQIQPHFLYNTLSTIQALCITDPERAAQTVEHFATYLRQNIDSLGQPKLIPFQKELEHTRIYTDIEQLRFPQIIINYDIEDSDFELPALTVQPLVENAIRHGVRSRKDGMISVVTREGLDHHIIVIMDNGKGFDVQQVMNSDESHIGLRNVKERIEKMCGGSLDVISSEGEGTTITIRLPKERGVI